MQSGDRLLDCRGFAGAHLTVENTDKNQASDYKIDRHI